LKNVSQLIDNASIQALELGTILFRLSELTSSPPGREQVLGLAGCDNPEDLEKELGRVTEMRDLLSFDDPFPLHPFSDIEQSLKKMDVQGAFLKPEELLALKDILVIIRQVKAYLDQREKKYSRLQKMAKALPVWPDIEKEINRIIDASGAVKDKASETLAALRRQIQVKSSQVRKRLDTILRTMVSKGYAQEDSLVLREGSLVIPVKESCRGHLKGIVLDQSASGATVFIEPIEILDLNNEIRRLKGQEAREIEKLLIGLTDQIRPSLSGIRTAYQALIQLDVLAAKARFSIQLGANAAGIDDKGDLDLVEARHPLLLMREKRESVVPLTLKMIHPLRSVVITGPNAGGKTVALKTVGLLALMHQYGLHIPVKEGSSLPFFSRIFADIGDQQSIEQDLSTFSSHVQNLKAILTASDNSTLVLLDEIGSSTDPAEGAALAEAVLCELYDRGSLALATTHLGSLKVFAHEHEGMENGSMVFDQKTLTPTYYFQMGIPGSSYAFEIAQRLGLSGRVIERAKSIVGEERGTVDRLIFYLEEQVQKTRELMISAELKESRLSGFLKLYEDKLSKMQDIESEAREKAVHEAEAVLKEANAVIEKVVQNIRERDADKDSIKDAKKNVQAIKEKIQAGKKVKTEPSEYQPQKGDWVLWSGHSGQGRVVSRPDSKGRVQVQWDQVKLRVPGRDLRPGHPPAEKKVQTGALYKKPVQQVTNEIDLRGMMVDEAIEVVEKYLSDAVMAGFQQVSIIHGKGTGVLRREIGNYLKGHSLVKNKRLGNWNEGDTGVTILELK